ncbi:MAG: signal peptidase I [Lachnospiraceae bacterium]|nr:signal peptidase I [Lachnospiraceae bacterium]
MRKILNSIIRLITGLYLVVLAVLIVPGFLGISVETVTSGSMEPEIPTGSVVYVMPTAETKVSEGDVITFFIDQKNTKVTHRVIGIEKNDAGEICFRTKGDANKIADAKRVKIHNVLGTVKFSLPYIGRIAVKLSTGQGKLFLIMVLLFLMGSCSLLEKNERLHKACIKFSAKT